MSATRPASRLKTLLQYTLSAVIGFLLGLWLAFPAIPVCQWALAQAGRQGLSIEPSGLARSWPLGIKADSATISARALPGQQLRLDRVDLAPTLLPAPGLSLAAGLWQGRLEAKVDRYRNVRMRLEAAQIPAELSARLPLSLAGRISSLTFAGRLPLAGANRSHGELLLKSLKLSGLTALGANSDSLDLGNLNVRFEGSGNRISLTRLNGDGALRLAGSGTIWLGQTAATTRINLQLTLTPAPGLDASLRDLLSLLGKPAGDGSVKLRLTGTLASPRTG